MNLIHDFELAILENDECSLLLIDVSINSSENLPGIVNSSLFIRVAFSQGKNERMLQNLDFHSFQTYN